jgi:type IV secretory pathway component VirB8
MKEGSFFALCRHQPAEINVLFILIFILINLLICIFIFIQLLKKLRNDVPFSVGIKRNTDKIRVYPIVAKMTLRRL